MPLPWSKSAPKSDRRLEWKALKAKHAKTIKPSTVEVGLGKALDTNQKVVDAIKALDESELNVQAFAPVLASWKAIRVLIASMKAKAKEFSGYEPFLKALEDDAEWWEYTAKELTRKVDTDVSDAEHQANIEILNALFAMQEHAAKVDLLLKIAGKKKRYYIQYEGTRNYIAKSTKLHPHVVRLQFLAKTPVVNSHLIYNELRLSRLTFESRNDDLLDLLDQDFVVPPNDVEYAKWRTEAKLTSDGWIKTRAALKKFDAAFSARVKNSPNRLS